MSRACPLLIAGIVILGISSVQGDDQTVPSRGDPGKIAVTIEGSLINVVLSEGPNDEAPKFSSASVYAAGKELRLDCSKCIEARRAIPRAVNYGRLRPDAGTPISIIVKGTLEFRPLAPSKISREKPSTPSVARDSKLTKTDAKANSETEPVVVVESLSSTGPYPLGLFR
jgi:hypothetical protein